MIVAQLSDPHVVAVGELLYGRVDTAQFLARSVAEILTPDAPLRFMFEPPGYQLHVWFDRGLVSHTAVIGDWAGPYPLRAEPAS